MNEILFVLLKNIIIIINAHNKITIVLLIHVQIINVKRFHLKKAHFERCSFFYESNQLKLIQF